MNSTFLRTGLAGVAAAVFLAGCGGGGGGDGDPAPADLAAGSDVPLSATQSATEATRFVRDTANTRSDSADPLRIGDANLATSDSAEPEPI